MINVKKAKVEDYWRTTFKRSYPLTLINISSEENSLFNNINLSMKPGLNALVGKNGIGKSNLMRALFNTFVTDESNQSRIESLLDDNYINYSLKTKEDIYNVSRMPSNGGESTDNLLAVMYDPCTLIPRLQHFFKNESHFDELLEAYTPVELSQDKLKVVNYLTNSNYTNVTFYNIEGEYDEFPILPYFIVELGDIVYNSSDMGLGELSLIYAFWLTDYIAKKDKNCLLFIEEPESFLPPLTQKRLTTIFAWLLSNQGINILISTHSEHILERIPHSHIKIIQKIGSKTEVNDINSKDESLSLLGLSEVKKGVLFFEDSAALIFANVLIAKSSKYTQDSFHYHISGSEGDLLKTIELLPPNLGLFKLISVFDGDTKGKYIDKLKNKTNYSYLPLKLSPEEVIIEYINLQSPIAISNCLSVDVNVFIMAKNKAEGADHHDFFIDISNTLKIPFNTLFSSLCYLWASDERNETELMNFLDSL